LPDQSVVLHDLPLHEFEVQSALLHDFPLHETPDHEIPDHEFPDQEFPDHDLPFQAPPDQDLPSASSAAIAAESKGEPMMSCSPVSVTPSAVR